MSTFYSPKNLPIYFCKHFYTVYFKQKLGQIAPNVPAVYDGLATAIKKPVGFRHRQNVLE
jgi:hypothetical protein